MTGRENDFKHWWGVNKNGGALPQLLSNHPVDSPYMKVGHQVNQWRHNDLLGQLVTSALPPPQTERQHPAGRGEPTVFVQVPTGPETVGVGRPERGVPVNGPQVGLDVGVFGDVVAQQRGTFGGEVGGGGGGDGPQPEPLLDHSFAVMEFRIQVLVEVVVVVCWNWKNVNFVKNYVFTLQTI